jgi:hypothetical protein
MTICSLCTSQLVHTLPLSTCSPPAPPCQFAAAVSTSPANATRTAKSPPDKPYGLSSPNARQRGSTRTRIRTRVARAMPAERKRLPTWKGWPAWVCNPHEFAWRIASPAFRKVRLSGQRLITLFACLPCTGCTALRAFRTGSGVVPSLERGDTPVQRYTWWGVYRGRVPPGTVGKLGVSG